MQQDASLSGKTCSLVRECFLPPSHLNINNGLGDIKVLNINSRTAFYSELRNVSTQGATCLKECCRKQSYGDMQYLTRGTSSVNSYERPEMDYQNSMEFLLNTENMNQFYDYRTIEINPVTGRKTIYEDSYNSSGVPVQYSYISYAPIVDPNNDITKKNESSYVQSQKSSVPKCSTVVAAPLRLEQIKTLSNKQTEPSTSTPVLKESETAPASVSASAPANVPASAPANVPASVSTSAPTSALVSDPVSDPVSTITESGHARRKSGRGRRKSGRGRPAKKYEPAVLAESTLIDQAVQSPAPIEEKNNSDIHNKTPEGNTSRIPSKYSKILGTGNNDARLLFQTPMSAVNSDNECSDLGFTRGTSVPALDLDTPKNFSNSSSRIPAKYRNALIGSFKEKFNDSIASIESGGTNALEESCNETCKSDSVFFSDENSEDRNDDSRLDLSSVYQTPKQDLTSLDATFTDGTIAATPNEEFFTPSCDDIIQTGSQPRSRRRRRRPLVIRKSRKKSYAPPEYHLPKTFIREAYDVQIPAATLIESSGNFLSEESIQDDLIARAKYLDTTEITKSGGVVWINLGLQFKMEALYRAPYPPRFALLNELYVCRTCFSYYATAQALTSHMERCVFQTMPPGTEIYRDTVNHLSIFEVRGDDQQLYCSNLSMLTMLWLRDKVVYLDVQPFSYFVLATPNADGHFLPLGYFSKQRVNGENHNLCCFCILPCFQKRGFGRFLIDFSYAISRLENKPGGPERPFSPLGEMAYKSYWFEVLSIALADILDGRMDNSLKALVKHTGMQADDIINTLNDMFSCFRREKKKSLFIALNNQESLIRQEAQKIINKRAQLEIRNEYFEPNYRFSLIHSN